MVEPKLREILIKFINEYFVKESGTVLDTDASLIEEGILDSTGVIELVAFIEETFNIRVEDEEIIPDNLDSINKLVHFIQPKLAKTEGN